MRITKTIALAGGVFAIVYFAWGMDDRYTPMAELTRIERKDDKYHAKRDHAEAQQRLWKFQDRYGGEGCPKARGEQKQRCRTLEQQERDAFEELQRVR